MPNEICYRVRYMLVDNAFTCNSLNAFVCSMINGIAIREKNSAFIHLPTMYFQPRRFCSTNGITIVSFLWIDRCMHFGQRLWYALFIPLILKEAFGVMPIVQLKRMYMKDVICSNVLYKSRQNRMCILYSYNKTHFLSSDIKIVLRFLYRFRN